MNLTLKQSKKDENLSYKLKIYLSFLRFISNKYTHKHLKIKDAKQNMDQAFISKK